MEVENTPESVFHKKFIIKTHGCQMNVYDSEIIEKMFANKGYIESPSIEEADIVVINTCNIREKATEKLYSELGRITRQKIIKQKETGKYTVIAVIGCVAQAEGEIVFKRSKLVDIVAGSQAYHLLGDMVEKAFIDSAKQTALDFEAFDKFDFIAEELEKNNATQEISNKIIKPSAFVTVQEGCDRFCTFCVVPYTRGPEVSRNVDSILTEVKNLRDCGTKEVVLLGQNVNAFHGNDSQGRTWSLAALIAEIAEIEGIERIKYTTSHPCYMSEDLISLYGCEEKLSPVLNLPVQSGSNAILRKMNRKHKADLYVDLIDRMRKIRKDLIVSSDFIVGFPTETDENFQETMDFVKRVVFNAQSFAFKYSIRPGTPAANMEQVPEHVKEERLKQLQEVLEEQRQSFSQTCIQKQVNVLFDNMNTRYPHQLAGRTEFNQIAIVNNLKQEERESMFAKIIKCQATELLPNSIICKIL